MITDIKYVSGIESIIAHVFARFSFLSICLFRANASAIKKIADSIAAEVFMKALILLSYGVDVWLLVRTTNSKRKNIAIFHAVGIMF